MLPAERTFRILTQLELAEFHLQGVVKQQPPHQSASFAKDQLYGFGGLNETYGPGEDTQHASFGAAWDQAGWRWFRIEAAIAGTFPGIEYRGLAFETEDAAVDIGLVQKHASIVDQIASRKIVGTIDDNVVVLQNVESIVGPQHRLIGIHLNVRVDA